VSIKEKKKRKEKEKKGRQKKNERWWRGSIIIQNDHAAQNPDKSK
jgi:hypothetical protein